MDPKPTAQFICDQVAAYRQLLPVYETYAAALKRVLEAACKAAVPSALVEARPKGVASFAEKCVRKYAKYKPDPVAKMTDLCGARIIVQTLSQVKAVQSFIDANFEVVERDDKTKLLGENTFGYRDLHYLLKLKPERALLIGFTAEEFAIIGGKIAEVQVRSLVEHAWADTLHDRMYKTPLRLSGEAKRTGALLAAIMEDGDRNFDQLANELDSRAANYTAYTSRANVEEEIKVQELILKGENNLPAALRLARLLGPAGKYPRVDEVLQPFVKDVGPLRSELLLELGRALCRVHRKAPLSADYQCGQEYLEQVVTLCLTPALTVMPNPQKQKSLRARAHTWLAWSWDVVPHAHAKTRMHYREALEAEPANPYYLSNQLGYEVFCKQPATMIDSMRTTLRLAIKTCLEHALEGTELPYALFTAGRLTLLLGKAEESLGWYARGLRHFFEGHSCVSPDLLEDELEWIRRLHFGAENPPEAHSWLERLIVLGQGFHQKFPRADSTPVSAPAFAAHRVLIVAGGAKSMTKEVIDRAEPMLEAALVHFHKKIISGGTKVGVPGCVGRVAGKLKAAGKKKFTLVGYIPRHLPSDAPKDEVNYDEFVEVSEDALFSPGQIIRTWEDLLRDSVNPREVLLLGIGGGPLAAIEYRVAFALGAAVAIVQGSGGAADAILADPVWGTAPSIMALPFDQASLQAFVTEPALVHEAVKVEQMAQAFHAHYVRGNPVEPPANKQPWDKLEVTYQKANREQARYAVEILHVAGFDVRPSANPKIYDHKSKDYADRVESMAELEHGRWNVERLQAGWRPGVERDDAKKIHPCLVPWQDLPDHIKEYDREAVRAFPAILAQAGLEVVWR